MNSKAQEDIEFILSKINHLGGDHWTTPDLRVGKGSPFSTRDAGILLSELGLTKENKYIKGIAETIFKTQREDGKFRISPSGTHYVCYTITMARVLHAMGYVGDSRLEPTLAYLLDDLHMDGAWRCKAAKLGKNPYSDASNPGTTLEALDVLRHTPYLNNDDRLDEAVEFLLEHWELKRPLGPCSFGIGTLFMQTEFPFLRYNLFYYCHTLSFYNKAKNDSRFLEALSALKKKLVEGNMIVENPNRRLAKMNLCRKGKPSEIATKRFNEMIARL